MFRGATIAAMILVNNPGTWSALYPPVGHAEWHGCTPTDLVFPFFLFIVGVAISLALPRQREKGKSDGEILLKVLQRSAILFLLGLFLAGFPRFGIDTDALSPSYRFIYYLLLAGFVSSLFILQLVTQKAPAKTYSPQTQRMWRIATAVFFAATVAVGFTHFDLSHIRIPGVLPRIALVYLISSIIFVKTGWKAQIGITAGLLLLYWFLMAVVPVPGIGPANFEAETNLGAWLDRLLLDGHLWSQSKTWDPEGLLSTLPAIGTGLLGVLTGTWLQSDHPKSEIVIYLFIDGAICIVLALFWDLVFPINKKIWTSSYVLYSGGIAMQALAICYWFIDVKKPGKWIEPLMAYGSNAITAFVGSGMVAILLGRIKVGDTSLQGWIFDTFYASWLSPVNASLLFAITFVTVFFIPFWVLYRRKIMIKV